MQYGLERVIRGQDTISVTGSICGDYLTDLFPIARSWAPAPDAVDHVPRGRRGGMYETGAGLSAPSTYEAAGGENHLRCVSLGEFLALAVAWRTWA